MKLVKFNSTGLFVLIAALILQFGGKVYSETATLTVTPSAVSNSYTGFITLNIGGLTNGQQVKVQTYLDLNSNGVVEANDPLVDVFNIADGGAEVIGGVTNVSVPYDSNPTSGAITTTLSFALPLESIVGQRIYRVTSDPSGAFTPVTAVLNITNATAGQSVSGIVYSNGVTPMPGALVAALTLTNQNYVSGVIADASGHYFLTLNPGTYVILPVLPGFYTDQNLSPEVTLTNGMSVTNNLSLTNGTVSISGSVYDEGNSNTLGGVFLQAQSSSLFAVTFSDTNGNYTFEATSNNWKIKLSAERPGRRGYLTFQGNTLLAAAGSGNVTNANIGLYRGNALFYGQVTISGTPVPNVPVGCNDSEQIFSGKGYTDANGNYGVVALVNTNVLDPNATWFCAPNTGNSIYSFLNNYIFDQIDNVNFTNNPALLENFIGLPVTTSISGRVVNNQGIPVSGLGMGASASIDGNQFVTAFVDTDTNGDFSFGAASGQWYVNANCCGNDGLDNYGYYDPANYHIVNIPPSNPTVNIVIYPANIPLLGQPGKVTLSQFNLNLYGASGYNYTVQTSTNLAMANWSTLTIVSNFPSSPYLIQDFQATNSARFYRAFQGP
jgi:hypothetical protein